MSTNNSKPILIVVEELKLPRKAVLYQIYRRRVT